MNKAHHLCEIIFPISSLASDQRIFVDANFIVDFVLEHLGVFC